jgi:hypothetical protein
MTKLQKVLVTGPMLAFLLTAGGQSLRAFATNRVPLEIQTRQGRDIFDCGGRLQDS